MKKRNRQPLGNNYHSLAQQFMNSAHNSAARSKHVVVV